MGLELKTDGEKMIHLEGKIDRIDDKIDGFGEKLERFIEALEKLEANRIQAMEGRLNKIEKWVSEWSGAYKLIAILGLILGIFASIKSFFP